MSKRTCEKKLIRRREETYRGKKSTNNTRKMRQKSKDLESIYPNILIT